MLKNITYETVWHCIIFKSTGSYGTFDFKQNLLCLYHCYRLIINVAMSWKYGNNRLDLIVAS